MSNVIVPDEAKMVNANLLLASSGAFALLRLFQTNLVVDHTTIWADLDAAVATFTGYADGVLAGGVVAGVLDAGNRAVTTFDPITFTKNGATGNQIYGYWIETSAPALQFVEKFDAPIPLLVDGAFIQITPKVTEKSQFLNP